MFETIEKFSLNAYQMSVTNVMTAQYGMISIFFCSNEGSHSFVLSLSFYFSLSYSFVMKSVHWEKLQLNALIYSIIFSTVAPTNGWNTGQKRTRMREYIGALHLHSFSIDMVCLHGSTHTYSWLWVCRLIVFRLHL